MAKKSMLEREYKRKRLVNQYSEKRKEILKELKKADSVDMIFELNEKLQKLPLSYATEKSCIYNFFRNN